MQKPNESEKKIQSDIMAEFGAKPFCRIWRVNVGKGYGQFQISALLDLIQGRQWNKVFALAKTLAPFSFGPPNGHADIGGLMANGQALYIEVKTATGKQSKDQVIFENMVNRFNGIYILARSVKDVQDALESRGYNVHYGIR